MRRAHTSIATLLLVFSALLVTGCTPVISKPVLNSADRSIAFQDLQAHPEQFVGKTVVVGGQIVTATVKEDETWIEVVQKALDRDLKPEETDRSQGRFIIVFKGFVDPAIYAAGRQITVAGEVQGKKVLPLNQIKYTYPVIVPKEHHVWQPGEKSSPRFGIGIGVGVGL